MRITSCFFALFAIVAFVGFASADMIDLSMTTRMPTAAEIGGDAALEGAMIHDFWATTDGDVLAINFVGINPLGILYKNTLGSEVEAPNPAFVAAFPALGATSYLTTPGGTGQAGGNFGNAQGQVSWYDADDTGPLDNYKWGQLTTLAGATGTFTGRFDIAGAEGPYGQEFSFDLGGEVIPEPSTFAILGIALIGLGALLRKR